MQFLVISRMGCILLLEDVKYGNMALVHGVLLQWHEIYEHKIAYHAHSNVGVSYCR
jgi:hypothetical protein